MLIDPTNPYGDLPKDMLFDRSKLVAVEAYAHSLQFNEVLEQYGVFDFDDLNENDQKYFKYAYNSGRRTAAMYAYQKLQEQMSGKDGVSACLSYLVQFAPGWEKAEEAADKEKPLKFKVELS